MVRVGIIGFGGICQSSHLGPHIELENAGKSKLVAVCDIKSERFEKATVIFDNDVINVYPYGDEPFKAEIQKYSCYKAEMEYFTDCIRNGRDNCENRPEDSALTVKLVNTLIESSEKNGEFIKFNTD